MKEIKVSFGTLTPLWTGDAWRENKEIRPSSIMGSLRFWFEVICYFAGITSNSNYENGKLKDDLNFDEFKKKLSENGVSFEGLDKNLAGCKISLPSRVFGCTGWKGWVRIKGIGVAENKENYNFPVGRIEFKELEYTKKYFDKKDNKEKMKKVIPAWYFPKGFFGKFTVTFEIKENILEPVFYPLLRFIEKYGFLGGKWNIGYGRVKIDNIDDELWIRDFANKNDSKVDFKFNDTNSKELSKLILVGNNFSISTQPYEFLKFFLGAESFYCFNERDFQEKASKLPRDIRIAKLSDNFSDFQNAIQELLKIKAKMRNCLRPNNSITEKEDWNNFRHNLLGTTSQGLEGTKIIPWIYEENGQLKGGFVSIAGILGMGGN